MINFPVLTTLDYSAPTVPIEAERYYPDQTDSFGAGLFSILKKALAYTNPALTDAIGICVCIFLAVLLIHILNSISDSTDRVHRLIGVVSIAIILIEPSNTLIQLGVETIQQLSDYGKLLFPIMTTTLAAEGGITTSSALYIGTTVFNIILMGLLSNLIIPLIYIYIVLSVAYSAVGNDLLNEIKKFIKWLMTWILKTTLYIFTGYMGITGIVSGTTDAAALKATKLAISGVVPVVGNIISDASESILISAGVVKNSVGVFGLFALFSIWIGPFLQIGIQYILLKITTGLCGIFADKHIGSLIKDFTGVFGMILACIGAICLMLLISTVCFMKGIRG